MGYFTHKFFGEPEGIPARQVKVRIPLQVRGIGVEVVFAGTGAAVLQGREGLGFRHGSAAGRKKYKLSFIRFKKISNLLLPKMLDT